MSDVLEGPGEVPACPRVSPRPTYHSGPASSGETHPRGSGALISDARTSEGERTCEPHIRAWV